MQSKEPMPVIIKMTWMQAIELGIGIAIGLFIFSLPFACLIFFLGGSVFR